MAFQTKGAEIGEIAFSTAFDYRNDVIGIPQTATKAVSEVPFSESFVPSRAPKLS